MTTLYENYTTGSEGGQHIIGGASWQGQTLTPSISHIISSVRVKVHRVGSPGTFTISIRAITNDLPSGADLAVGTMNGNAVTTNTDGEWIDITFSTGALAVASTKYAIVCRCAGAAGGNYLAWHADTTSPTYAGGSLVQSGDSGTSWQEATESDEMFEEYGDPQGSGEGGFIFPVDDVARVSSIRHIVRPGFARMQVGLGDLGFDIDIAEATVRKELDTSKEPEHIPPAPTPPRPPEPESAPTSILPVTPYVPPTPAPPPQFPMPGQTKEQAKEQARLGGLFAEARNRWIKTGSEADKEAMLAIGRQLDALMGRSGRTDVG